MVTEFGGRCLVCRAATDGDAGLCSHRCLREAVAELDRLHPRRKALARLLTGYRRRRWLYRSTHPAQRRRAEGWEADLEAVTARTHELTAALLGSRVVSRVAERDGAR